MPMTARERAQKALDTLNTKVDKALEKRQKADEKLQKAREAAEKVTREHVALLLERDHLAGHPALVQEGAFAVPANASGGDDKVADEVAVAVVDTPAAAQAETVIADRVNDDVFDPFK